MKWIFALLLLVNIGFLGWQLTRGYAGVVGAPAASPVLHQANRLVLLSEVPGSELRRRDRGAVGGGLSGESCFSVGPLSSDEKTTNLRAWLEAQGATVSLRSDEWREQVWYWVYFEPFETRTAAQERVRSLQDEGFRDISIIARGDMANAVSLGVYSRRSSLEKRLAELQARGYKPAVLPRHRTQKAAWFDIRLAADSGFSSAHLRQAFPGMETAPSRCE
jgi:hypothetical protein